MAVLGADEAVPSAPAAVAPPPGHPRFPLIDALRAIAALTVLLYHAGSLSGAAAHAVYGIYLARLNVGVALFFLISGFLLYRPFAAHRLLGAPGTRLRDYARRRLVRILPAYWLALTVLAIWPGLPGVFSGHFWVYYGFLQAYDDNTVLRGIGPAWTLCVEMSFYVALPLYAGLVAAALRRRTRRVQVRVELGLLSAVTLASLATRWWLSRDAPFSPLLNTLPTFADWFAVGMMLALASVALQARPAGPPPAVVRLLARAPWLSWLAALACFWAASRWFGGPHALYLPGHVVLLFTAGEGLGIHVLFAAVGAGLLAPAVFGTGPVLDGRATGRDPLRRLLGWRVLGWLGLISYGIYLWQQPLIDKACQVGGPDLSCHFHGITELTHIPFLACTVIGFGLAVACAAASYYVVERPALRLKDRRRAHS